MRQKSPNTRRFNESTMEGRPEHQRLTPEVLLGRRLNDVEQKFAPEELFVGGPMPIPLPQPRVSIVGSRKASTRGLESAKLIAKVLVQNGVLIVSGLAEGIDTMAHKTAIENDGRTVAVIGTPLDKTYPGKNLSLQEEIMRNHLVVSQFPFGHRTTPKDFVLRNRTMALISDATVIAEAGEASGSRHQGWEALRLGRSLFIWSDLVDDKRLRWPAEMMQYGAIRLDDPEEIIEVLPSSLPLVNVSA